MLLTQDCTIAPDLLSTLNYLEFVLLEIKSKSEGIRLLLKRVGAVKEKLQVCGFNPCFYWMWASTRTTKKVYQAEVEFQSLFLLDVGVD